MRCPYCGGLNQDTSAYCRSCGRDLRYAPRALQKAPTPPTRPVPPQQLPGYQPSNAPYPVKAAQAAPASAMKQPVSMAARTVQQSDSASVAPASQPPEEFPPRTMAQLETLQKLALDYSLVSDDESTGGKRIVRVLYKQCAPWQQIATLYTVLQKYQEDHAQRFNTVIVQGLTHPDANLYSFDNGQLIYDRNVRLGNQILHRLQIETDNGFTATAVRVVLTEAAN
jgi:hypothetical protein